MTLPPMRMRLSQKASHPRAGGIAHRSARSQEFAGGARTPEEINARAYAGHALFREAYKRKKRPTPGMTGVEASHASARSTARSASRQAQGRIYWQL